jgi:hypothetical protein
MAGSIGTKPDSNTTRAWPPASSTAKRPVLSRTVRWRRRPRSRRVREHHNRKRLLAPDRRPKLAARCAICRKALGAVDRPAASWRALRSAHAGPVRPNGGHSGVWLSRYQYYSSGRREEIDSAHYLVILRHGDRLAVRSVHRPERSLLTMDLTVDGSVLTGTWAEENESDSYYRGARYHGAIQLLAEPTGRRLAGKWVGLGKEVRRSTWSSRNFAPSGDDVRLAFGTWVRAYLRGMAPAHAGRARGAAR